MLRLLLSLTCVVFALMSLSGYAQEKQHEHTEGMKHDTMVSGELQPTQGGDAAFAAIIEIVGLLEQDPNTPWDQVDIDLLRMHLLDMNQVMLNTTAKKEVVGDKEIIFTITGDDKSVASVHRMVPAHSIFIQEARGWVIEPVLTETGAILTVTTENPAAVKRLWALGFYGFMSLESHHQAHHYQMALGHSH